MAANNTLATIEFDLQGNILNASQNFLRAMGYLEEIKGGIIASSAKGLMQTQKKIKFYGKH